LIAEDPVNPDNRRLLVLTYQHDGEYRERSDKRDALGFFRKAAALGEELLAADPVNALTRKDLAYSDKAMADFLADFGENSQALLHFSNALESYEKVVADAPSDLNSRFMLVTCRAGVARLQARLGDVERALDDCSKAESDLQEITGEKPGHLGRIQAVEYLARAHVALADIPQASASRRREHTSIACDLFRQSLRIMDEARVAKGSLGKDESWAAEITGELAKCDAALGQ
jgi:tetratricopeptide (TPR) repeat protein